MSGALSPTEAIALLRERGYTDEEIVDEFGRYGRMALRVDDGVLGWTVGTAGTAQQQRLLREWLGGHDDGIDQDWSAIRDAFRRWTAREGNHGQRMNKDEWLAETRMGRDRFDAALRRHAVRDVRRLEATFRAEGL